MLIEIDGGAMIGYCATDSKGIEIAPTRQMKSATTQAKIGLSMKKLGMSAYRLIEADDRDVAVASVAALACVQACGMTLSPAANFWKPSTTTRSPAFRPSVTSH